MKTTQTTTITKTMPKMTPKPQRAQRNRSLRTNQVISKVVNSTTPVAYGTTVRNNAGAKINSTGNVTRVCHREFVADISATSSSFLTNVIAVNPGNPQAFPWLSAIAVNYETYTFKKLAYRYVPLCPTSTQGRITMALDFDARDTTPTSKAVLSQYQGAVATPVWQQGLYTCTPANLVKGYKQRYVSGATVPTNTDVKTYHLGSFILSSSNTPAASTQLGELWVEYEVEFQTPQIATTTTLSNNPEKLHVTGGAQRTRIGIRNQLPVLDTSFTDEIQHILGGVWQQVIDGVTTTKFSVVLNKYLNHPVLYMIKYGASNLGPIKIVRPANVNTGFYAPSFRQFGYNGSLPLGEFSSVDVSSTTGLGISDPVNDFATGRRFLSFVSFPNKLIDGADNQNVASQIQFMYNDGSANQESIIEIQSFALPPMTNTDTSNSVMTATPVAGSGYDTINSVELAGWLRLNNYVAQSTGTLRQTTEEDGSVSFKSLRKILRAETEELHKDVEQDELSANLYGILEALVERIKLKSIQETPDES